MADYVVVAQGSNASVGDVLVFGPFGSEEDADAAKHEIRAEDGNLHQFSTAELLDPEETVEAQVKPPYEQDAAEAVLRDLAIEEIEKQEEEAEAAPKDEEEDADEG